MLAERDVQSLLLEGGSRIHGAFVARRLVDGVALFLAPRLVGSGVPIVEGAGLDWKRPIKLGSLQTQILGPDILITADVAHPGGLRHGPIDIKQAEPRVHRHRRRSRQG
jgi:diaminohydroxyphosphoribosylaminopyrimidine deaminase/5-amino-6-(5-phosphoribosylamino)uracil reductase